MREKRKILIADDEEDVRDALKDVLLTYGNYEVRTVANGSDAYDLYTSEPFDVVLLDIMMPGIDGVKACKTIKGVNPEAVVIAITGFPDDEKVNQILKAGAYRCIPKPILPSFLIGTIEAAIAHQSWKQNLYKNLKEGER